MIGVLVIVVALGVTGVAVTGGPETAHLTFGNFAVTSSVGVVFLLGMVTATILLLGLWCVASGMTQEQRAELDDLPRRAAGNDDVDHEDDEPVREVTSRDRSGGKRRPSDVVGATVRASRGHQEVRDERDERDGRDRADSSASQDGSLTLPRQTVRSHQITAEPYIQDQDPEFVPEPSVPVADTGGIDPVDSGALRRTTVPEQSTTTSSDPEGEYSKG